MPPSSSGAHADGGVECATHADGNAHAAPDGGGVDCDAHADGDTHAAPDGGARHHHVAAAARNVRLAYAFNALSSLATSIVLGSFFSTYLYSLSSSNDVVGYISATAGLAMIAVAAPVGFFTDRWPRHWMLRLSGLVGAAASAAMFVALQADSLGALYGAAAAYGVYSACNGAPLNSILADSTGAGDRTRVFILQYALSLLAGAGGPLVATLFFWRLGNRWETPVLRAVMHAGNGLNAASTALLWLFVSDEAAAAVGGGKRKAGDKGGSGSNADEAVAGVAAVVVAADRDGDEGGVACGATSTAAVAASAAAAAVAASTAADTAAHRVEQHTSTRNLGHQTLRLPCGCCCRGGRGGGGAGALLTVRAIPYIIFTSDMLIAIGAGMTVQFFALYFANDLHLSPLLVSAVYVASPVSVALFSLAAIPVSRRGVRPGGRAAKLPCGCARPSHLSSRPQLRPSVPRTSRHRRCAAGAAGRPRVGERAVGRAGHGVPVWAVPAQPRVRGGPTVPGAHRRHERVIPHAVSGRRRLPVVCGTAGRGDPLSQPATSTTRALLYISPTHPPKTLCAGAPS
jgi:MFS family permease